MIIFVLTHFFYFIESNCYIQMSSSIVFPQSFFFRSIIWVLKKFLTREDSFWWMSKNCVILDFLACVEKFKCTIQRACGQHFLDFLEILISWGGIQSTHLDLDRLLLLQDSWTQSRELSFVLHMFGNTINATALKLSLFFFGPNSLLRTSIISRPGRSQGLLYKHLRHWFIC